MKPVDVRMGLMRSKTKVSPPLRVKVLDPKGNLTGPGTPEAQVPRDKPSGMKSLSPATIEENKASAR